MNLKQSVCSLLIGCLTTMSVAYGNPSKYSSETVGKPGTRSVAEIKKELQELDSKLTSLRIEQGLEVVGIVATVALTAFLGRHAYAMHNDPKIGGKDIAGHVRKLVYVATAGGVAATSGLGYRVYYVQTEKIPQLRQEITIQIEELKHAEALEKVF